MPPPSLSLDMLMRVCLQVDAYAISLAAYFLMPSCHYFASSASSLIFTPCRFQDTLLLMSCYATMMPHAADATACCLCARTRTCRLRRYLRHELECAWLALLCVRRYAMPPLFRFRAPLFAARADAPRAAAARLIRAMFVAVMLRAACRVYVMLRVMFAAIDIIDAHTLIAADAISLVFTLD